MHEFSYHLKYHPNDKYAVLEIETQETVFEFFGFKHNRRVRREVAFFEVGPHGPVVLVTVPEEYIHHHLLTAANFAPSLAMLFAQHGQTVTQMALSATTAIQARVILPHETLGEVIYKIGTATNFE
jgi:hypothetical protein